MEGWRPIAEMTQELRYAGGYLLHGPALVHPDFNPEGVERGHWQDGALPGYWQDGAGTEGAATPEGGCWCLPGWDNDNEEFFTRFVAHADITHFAPVPRGPHSFADRQEGEPKSD
jgi:hypothetical protein